MSQLSKWTVGGKISKLVIVITSKETGENVERWQFDVSKKSNLKDLELGAEVHVRSGQSGQFGADTWEPAA